MGQLLLRDVERGAVWSAGLQPYGGEPDGYATTDSPGCTCIVRRDGALETTLETAVAGDRDVELRRPTLAQLGIDGEAADRCRVGLEAMLGFQLRGDRVLIDPCIPKAWPGFTITYRYRSSCYVIEVENPAGTSRGVAKVELDGVSLTRAQGLRVLVGGALLVTILTIMSSMVMRRLLRADTASCSSGTCTSSVSNTNRQCNAWFGDCGASWCASDPRHRRARTSGR